MAKLTSLNACGSKMQISMCLINSTTRRIFLFSYLLSDLLEYCEAKVDLMGNLN